mmetsp:Transcript_16627/g.23696  ORF Transcript_16627/g.23696 Transcript_16627/m.23696 type:complete len:88 (+) Transcript_16627:381-644(+)
MSTRAKSANATTFTRIPVPEYICIPSLDEYKTPVRQAPPKLFKRSNEQFGPTMRTAKPNCPSGGQVQQAQQDSYSSLRVDNKTTSEL